MLIVCKNLNIAFGAERVKNYTKNEDMYCCNYREWQPILETDAFRLTLFIVWFHINMQFRYPRPVVLAVLATQQSVKNDTQTMTSLAVITVNGSPSLKQMPFVSPCLSFGVALMCNSSIEDQYYQLFQQHNSPFKMIHKRRHYLNSSHP